MIVWVGCGSKTVTAGKEVWVDHDVSVSCSKQEIKLTTQLSNSVALILKYESAKGMCLQQLNEPKVIMESTSLCYTRCSWLFL